MSYAIYRPQETERSKPSWLKITNILIALILLQNVQECWLNGEFKYHDDSSFKESVSYPLEFILQNTNTQLVYKFRLTSRWKK